MLRLSAARILQMASASAVSTFAARKLDCAVRTSSPVVPNVNRDLVDALFPRLPNVVSTRELPAVAKSVTTEAGESYLLARLNRTLTSDRNIRALKCNKIYPEDIKTDGFTHLYWAFIDIDPKSFKLVPGDQSDIDSYRRFTALKKDGLQTWISVGGWFFSDSKKTQKIWSDMTSSNENRAKFVESARSVLEVYGFQGLDLDWEWPAATDRGGSPEDTQNQVKLVKELRAAFGTKYGLSVAISPDVYFLRNMDVKAMEQYVDSLRYVFPSLRNALDLANGYIVSLDTISTAFGTCTHHH
jgi:hypothetical protein